MTQGQSIRPKIGWYIYFDSQLSQVVGSDGAGIDIVPDGSSSDDISGVQQRIPLDELFSQNVPSDKIFLCASTKKEILSRMAMLEPIDEPVHQKALPKSLLVEAQMWKTSVDLVDELVREAEVYLSHENFSSPIIPGTIDSSICNILKLEAYVFYDSRKSYLVQVGKEYQSEGKITETRIRELACQLLSIKLSTYYRRRTVCRKYKSNVYKIAGSLRREDFNESRQDIIVRHFIDRCIMRYETTCKGIYDFAYSLWQRNKKYWFDIESIPNGNEDLIELLFSQEVPIDILLKNPDYREQLRQIDKLPSLQWFYKYFKRWQQLPSNAQDYIIKRYGRDVWEREYIVFDTFVRLASRPLEYVCGDHLRIDLHLVDKDNRQETYTLWFTCLLDCYTRCPIGIALLHEAPCIDSLQTALHHAIWTKSDYEDIKLSSLLPCYGIPENLSLDNAWAHHSDSLQTLADNVSCGGDFTRTTFHFRRPYKARQGALIERFFRNMVQRIRDALRDAGAIAGSNRRQRLGNREKACLLYRDLYKIILKIIVEYMHTIHSELDGLTPYEKWMQALEESTFIIIPRHDNAMKYNFYRHDLNERSINEHGVSAFNMHYTSKKLRKLGRRQKGQAGESFRISYDPDDISKIALFRNEMFFDELYSKDLLLPNGKIRSVSIAEMEIAKDVARSRGIPTGTWPQFIDTELAELIRKRRNEKKRVEDQTLNFDEEASTTDDQGRQGVQVSIETSSSEDDEYEEMRRALSNFNHK